MRGPAFPVSGPGTSHADTSTERQSRTVPSPYRLAKSISDQNWAWAMEVRAHGESTWVTWPRTSGFGSRRKNWIPVIQSVSSRSMPVSESSSSHTS